VKRIPIVFLLLVAALLASAQKQDDDAPPVVHFVAPAYPRAAKDQRIMGTTVMRISVAADGTVSEVSTVRAHPVFEKYVTDVLKQWRFKPSSQAHTLEITCSFEFYDEDCDKPLTPETLVSAELPKIVRIRTGLQCVQVPTSGAKR
jgi:TonB family protein